MALLELDGVCKQYGETWTPASVRVLDGVSLTLDAGESLAVVGPSGCGKSTLLNLVGALDIPTSGTIRFDGRDLGSMDENARADLRARAIGFVFQQHLLLPQCTVLENVLIPTLPLHRSAVERREDAERARDLLQRVGLGARLDHRPGRLSGGESQRAAVVRALINKPRLLLADEPTGSLDEKSANALGDLLVALNHDEGVALIVVTHSRELARRLAAVVRLEHGRLDWKAGI